MSFTAFMSLTAALWASGLPPSTQSHSDLLVTTAWLAAHQTDDNVRIIDMRTRGFDQGRIRGASLMPNDAIRIADRPPYFLPTVEEFEQLMTRHRITNATRVVVYDDRGGIYAARLWFVLNVFGHSNVALLDGGWTQWVKEGRPVSTEVVDVPEPKPGQFRAKLNTSLVATAAAVVAAIDQKGVTIVDARTQAEIDGKDLRAITRGGAIPSAKPLYWEDTLNLPDRTFKSRTEIERLYQDKAIPAGDDVIIYCQVGMRASHDAFTLALLGRTKVKVYYGSWEEWGNRDDLPIKK